MVGFFDFYRILGSYFCIILFWRKLWNFCVGISENLIILFCDEGWCKKNIILMLKIMNLDESGNSNSKYYYLREEGYNWWKMFMMMDVLKLVKKSIWIKFKIIYL